VATAPKLPEAISVMKNWGFTNKTNAVWIKDKIGAGYLLPRSAQAFIDGKKSSDISVPEEKNRSSLVIEGP
jgi:hypothetical protein